MNGSFEKIEFKMINDVSPEDAAPLYLDAGWIRPGDDISFIKTAFEKSFAVSAAYLDGKLIGFMRALSDGVSDAYMLDLVVLKQYRGQGIARRILENLVEHLSSFGIDWIVCIGAPETEMFYSKTSAKSMGGFTPLRFFGKNGNGEKQT